MYPRNFIVIIINDLVNTQYVLRIDFVEHTQKIG